MLKEALLVRGTPPSVKVARLYLLSDILHNSGAPIKHASNYRSLLSACLPEIFLELGALRRSILGRMTSRQVLPGVMDDIQYPPEPYFEDVQKNNNTNWLKSFSFIYN